MAVTAFTALSVGYLVSQRLSEKLQLRVHSCFQRTLNLHHPDGYLLPILSCDFQDLPDAIRIPLVHQWDWRHHARSGQDAYFSQGILQGSGWNIALAQATCWQPESIPPDGRLPSLPDALSHYATLAWQLSEYCHQHRIESDLQLLPGLVQSGSARHPPPRRVELWLNDSRKQLSAETTSLIGYGRGLTPDGDDYLLGYLAALWPWRYLPHIEIHAKILGDLIASQLSRTNDISKHYLARAVEGHFSAPICHLMQLLGSVAPAASAAQIEFAAQQVMQFGASSGVDCLAGALHGMRTLRSSLSSL